MGVRNGAVRSYQHSETLTSEPRRWGVQTQTSGDKDREDRKHRDLEMASCLQVTEASQRPMRQCWEKSEAILGTSDTESPG